MKSKKFIAMMLMAWAGTVIGDAVYFRFLETPIKRITG